MAACGQSGGERLLRRLLLKMVNKGEDGEVPLLPPLPIVSDILRTLEDLTRRWRKDRRKRLKTDDSALPLLPLEIDTIRLLTYLTNDNVDRREEERNKNSPVQRWILLLVMAFYSYEYSGYSLLQPNNLRLELNTWWTRSNARPWHSSMTATIFVGAAVLPLR